MRDIGGLFSGGLSFGGYIIGNLRNIKYLQCKLSRLKGTLKVAPKNLHRICDDLNLPRYCSKVNFKLSVVLARLRFSYRRLHSYVQ